MENREFIYTLKKLFIQNSNPIIAKNQKAYLRNKFEFYGINAKIRREILNKTLSIYDSKYHTKLLAKQLWQQKEREYHYCAQEILLIKNYKTHDIDLFEYMITNKSWWDTIDFIAPKILGKYFKLYPNQIDKKINQWIFSENIWLQRSCLIFQLKYKKDLNTKLLTYIINNLLNTDEFFIDKSIGWILREYSKTNSLWVRKFVHKTKLKSLSKREALRFINN